MLYSKRKMAKGGMAYKNDSAKTESRPMPSETDNDSKTVSQNSGNKPPKEDQWTDNPTVRQAQKPSITPLSRPRMVGSDSFSVRDHDEIKRGLDQTNSYPPGSPKQQPSTAYNEKDATKSGPKIPDNQNQHNNGKPAYAKGGQVEDQATEVIPDRGFGKIIILGKDGKRMADGGMVEDESQEERHASISAAIMAKRAAAQQLNSDSDMDEAVLMAEGGEILSHDSIYSDSSSQVDLARNAQEDANEEDQTSFNALRKENYSESEGLDQLDQPTDSNLKGDDREDAESDEHDMVSSIMKKRKSK